MKCYVSFVCFLSALVFVHSAPLYPVAGSLSASTNLQLGGSSPNGGGVSGLTNILSNIDLPGLLRGVNSFVKLVGVFCPPLSQVLDNVIQNVTSTAFRVFGSVILRNGGLGGGSSGGGGGGQRVNVVLPTYPPDEDDDDDDDEDDSNSDDDTSNSPDTFNAKLLSRSGNEGTTVAEKNSEPLVLSRADSSDSETTTNTNLGDEDKSEDTTTPRDDNNDETVKPTTLYTSPANEDSNLIAKRHVRVPREADDDQQGAESAPEPADDLSNVDDQDRNKRYLPFGGGSAEGHASGGSGNFLFDIIRLVAGSGATEESDEKANSPGGVVEVDVQKTHEGYSGEGIPGPITRLFVIANRGIANLVQDLILRLAATSEKLVNFKARLITSLI